MGDEEAGISQAGLVVALTVVILLDGDIVGFALDDDLRQSGQRHHRKGPNDTQRCEETPSEFVDLPLAHSS